MEAAVRHQTPGAHTRKVACAQAAGLRMNVLLRFPPRPRRVKIVLGLQVRQGPDLWVASSLTLSLASVQFPELF